MTPSPEKVGRILLGLRATSDGDRSVLTAITLAKAIKREIVGLFVIEEEMVEMAGLPFTCTLETGTAQRRDLTAAIMSKALDRGASRCRQSLSNQAHQANVSWSFSIESGKLSVRLSAAISAGDFLVISGDRFGFNGPHLLDQLLFATSPIKGIVIAPSRATTNKDGPIIVLDDGDTAGEETLLLGSRMAQATSRKLIVLALASSKEQVKNIADRATNMVPEGQKIITHRLVPGATDQLKATLAHLSPSFIIADMQGEPFGNDKAAQTLLRAARAPIVLLRA